MDPMSDDIAKTFESLVTLNEFKDAFELISGISNTIPPPSLINNIIFDILMENCEEKMANKANAYLCSYLRLLPPKSRDFCYYYRDALQDKSGKFDDIWSVFTHLVNSCFTHYQIIGRKKKECNPELVKYPHCDILIDFYAQMFINFLSLENDLFEDDPEERFSILLEWINKVYKLKNLRPYPVLDSLHMLLDKKVNSDILFDASTDKLEAIVHFIMDKCPDVFNNVEKMKGFFVKSNFVQVQLRICQHQLYKLIFHEKFPSEMHTPLTLKTIMYNYFFFASKQERSKRNKKPYPIGTTAAIDLKEIKQMFSLDSTKGDTILHELCRKKQYGDLFELILSDSNLLPNAKNDAGFTPLHVACLSGCYYCIKFLLEEVISDERVDVTATNNNGLTPLHCAAYVDSVEIVQILLKHGAVELVKLEDKFGRKAVDYAKSENLKKLLKNIESTIPASSSGKTVSNTNENLTTNLNLDCLTVPVMTDKNELSLFLCYLYTILSTYLNNYHLFDCKRNGMKKLSHKDNECHHFVPTSSSTICDEDVSIYECLPLLLDKFFECIQSYASNNVVELRLDLLPMVMLRNVLDC